MQAAHFNDVGAEFIIVITENDNPVDISTASTLQMKFRKPSCDTVTKTASFKVDGSDGRITYTSVDGDLDEVGVWEVQGIVDGLKSEVETFEVEENL